MSFPRSSERYDLLGTEGYRDLIAKTITAARTSILIISAFVTLSGLRWLRSNGMPTDVPVTIVTQWTPDDILSGASDLDAYRFAREQRWRFALVPKLHAKVLLVDNSYMFVGSANITAFGLSLVPGGNRELGLCVAANDSEIHTAWGVAEDAVDVSPELFARMEAWIAQFERSKPTSSNSNIMWPSEIIAAITPRPKRLWVADLPWATPTQVLESGRRQHPTVLREAVDHDVRLFGSDESPKVQSAFRTSQAYQWLLRVLQNEPEHCAYFGRLSELLHECLLDDPRPFRRDVKSLLSNLLDYVFSFAQDVIILDRPNQSMRVRLTSIA